MISNAMTVDVEDYFHVSAFSDSIPRGTWAERPLRVEANTHRLLDLFDAHRVSVTFFVLGWVAERVPHLVREIGARGHEVACHGYSHELIYRQAPDVFRRETFHAKALLEDQLQKPVRGYRAASYSITLQSLWALDILVEAGFTYDSSIFPVHHDRYGIPGAERHPYLLDTASGRRLVEFPLSTLDLGPMRVPVAGGGYFRLFPYPVTAAALRRINEVEGRPFIFYLHPWEIDPEQPRVRASFVSRFRHYNNLDRCEQRLIRLLKTFRFTTAEAVLTGLNLLDTDGKSLAGAQRAVG